MNFIRRLSRGNFIFQPTVLKFGDLLRGWKLATNTKFHVGISKIMPAMPIYATIMKYIYIPVINHVRYYLYIWISDHFPIPTSFFSIYYATEYK